MGECELDINKKTLSFGASLLAAALLAACQSSPTSLSDETIQRAQADYKEQKSRDIHNEYWQAQMEQEEARQAARERADEAARQAGTKR
jgi:hypothetical protein